MVDHTRNLARALSLGRSEVLSWAALALTVLFWCVSLAVIDPSRLDEFGLVPLLPLSFHAALAVLTASFSFSICRPQPPKWLLFFHIVLFILIVHATPALTYESLRYSWAWKHVGIVDYILRYGMVDRTIPNLNVYHNWPGFFAASALLTRAAGLESALKLAAWAPVFFNLLNFGALLVLFRALVSDERIVWLALWLVFITSWVGQDYFSPQALAFFFYLAALAVAARWFADRRGFALAQRSVGTGPGCGVELPASLSTWQAQKPTRGVVLTALLLLVALFAALSSSHQLTPIVTVFSLGALTLFTRNRALGLPVLMAVCCVSWIVYGATPFFQAEVGELIASFGQVSENFDANLVNFSDLSRDQQLVALAARGLTLAVWTLALVGVIKHMAQRIRVQAHIDWGLIGLAGAPFLLLAGNAYGGEVIFRIYLFSLPFMALWTAYLFSATRRSSLWPRVAAIFTLSTVLLSGFIMAYFGKEQQFYFSPSEVKAAQVMYGAAPKGALIIEGSPNYPSRYLKYEYYTQVAISREPLASRERVLSDPVGSMTRWMSDEAYTAAYLILTHSQETASEPLGALPPGSINAIWQALLEAPEFETLYRSDDAIVFTLKSHSRQGTP